MILSETGKPAKIKFLSKATTNNKFVDVEL